MHPETRLFVDAVDIHRELMSLLASLPGHRRLIREAFGTPEGDLEFLRGRFGDHPDRDFVEVLAAFSWLPASAMPTTLEIVGACR